MRKKTSHLIFTVFSILFSLITIVFIAYFIFKVNLFFIFTIIIILTPIWLPYILFLLTYDMWIWFVREKFKYKTGRTTLRIILPKEVYKSPEAMESVFNHIHNPGRPENYMQSYLDGKHPLVSSFEIVSIGGDVRFYVNLPTEKTKNAFETQMYALYPGIEIIEEDIDYTAEIKSDSDEWDLMSFHITKRNDQVLPIKTYIDFKHDQLPDEETKVEPMATLIEHLGRTKPHERLWIQILAVAHSDKNFRGGWLRKKKTWESDAVNKINEIMKRNEDLTARDEDTELRPVLTSSERDTVSAIERNVSKYAYEVAIRAMYITEKGKFDGEMIGPMLRSFSQYDMIGRNTIGVSWRTDFDYNFISDFFGTRREAMKKDELEYYKLRAYLSKNFKNGADAMKVMSIEELATIYHLPGSSVVTPALSRIDSTKGDAPDNLPVGDYKTVN